VSPWWILCALVVVVVLVWQVRRALGGPLERDAVIAAARARTEHLIGPEPDHDVGPGQLRLLEDTDAYLDRVIADDPELAAGFDRLRQAIRDHREDES
jgi:hypothetical protein